MYKLVSNSNFVRRLSDNAFIPADNGNRDWREYQEWLGGGTVSANHHTFNRDAGFTGIAAAGKVQHHWAA